MHRWGALKQRCNHTLWLLKAKTVAKLQVTRGEGIGTAHFTFSKCFPRLMIDMLYSTFLRSCPGSPNDNPSGHSLITLRMLKSQSPIESLSCIMKSFPGTAWLPLDNYLHVIWIQRHLNIWCQRISMTIFCRRARPAALCQIAKQGTRQTSAVLNVTLNTNTHLCKRRKLCPGTVIDMRVLKSLPKEAGVCCPN